MEARSCDSRSDNMPAPYIKGEATKGGTSIRKDGNNVVISDTFHYLVIADKDATRDEVRSTTGLPSVNFTRLANGAICTAKDAERDEKQPRLWRVSCTFETIPPDQEQNEESTPDPTTWIPKWGGSLQSIDFYGGLDADGNPVLNSAKRPFSDATAIKKSLISMQFSQYESASTGLGTIADRNDTVNSSSIKGFPAKTLLLNVRSFEYGTFYETPCVRIDYSLTYNKDTWIEKRLDIGYEYLVDGVLKPAFSGGSRIEVRLNGSGGKRADGDPDVFIDVKRYREISFSFLR